jgi:hypothetical protein
MGQAISGQRLGRERDRRIASHAPPFQTIDVKLFLDSSSLNTRPYKEGIKTQKLNSGLTFIAPTLNSLTAEPHTQHQVITTRVTQIAGKNNYSPANSPSISFSRKSFSFL